jgi:predicted Zn-dependent peptidase
VGEEELSRHRDQVKARLLLGLESPSGLMNHIGRDALLLGRVREVEEIARGLDAVDAQALGELAEEILSREPGLGVVGPPGAGERLGPIRMG